MSEDYKKIKLFSVSDNNYNFGHGDDLRSNKIFTIKENNINRLIDRLSTFLNKLDDIILHRESNCVWILKDPKVSIEETRGFLGGINRDAVASYKVWAQEYDEDIVEIEEKIIDGKTFKAEVTKTIKAKPLYQKFKNGEPYIEFLYFAIEAEEIPIYNDSIAEIIKEYA